MWRWFTLPWVMTWGLLVWVFFILPVWSLGLIKFVYRTPNRPVALFYVQFPDTKLGNWWRKKWGHNPSKDPTKPQWQWNGLALPACILIVSDGVRERMHELRHTDQMFVLGPLFPIVGGIILPFTGYTNHPFEKDARNYAKKGPTQ